MKKNLSFLAIALLVDFYALGQLPNYGFEDWLATEPNSWVSTNVLMLMGNPQSVYKTTDAHSGSAACEINTIHALYKPAWAPDIPDYTGSVFLGSMNGFVPLFGIPYSYRPGMVRFWYKYTPVSGDSAVVWVLLTKWNKVAKARDTIAFIEGRVPGSSTYTKAEFNIDYWDTRSADTLVILFSSSMRNFTKEGSKFIVDDVELSGAHAGIKANEKQGISVYPNPAREFINIYWGDIKGNIQVTVSDLQGKCMSTLLFNGRNGATMPTTAFAPGIYILNVRSEEGTTTSKIIVE